MDLEKDLGIDKEELRKLSEYVRNTKVAQEEEDLERMVMERQESRVSSND